MVFVALMPLVSGGPPTSAAFCPPLAYSPWHPAHFDAKMTEPCEGLPLPGGRPEPSGRMLISQPAISAAEIGVPRFGAWAKAALEPRASAMSTAALPRLRVHMFHLAIALDAPARGAVVVLARKGRHVRNRRPGLATVRDDLRAGRLHIAGLIPRAALQDGRPAIPVPGHAEPRERLGVHRLLQRRLPPARAAVGRHHDLRDPSVAGIRHAGDLVEARPIQLQPGRGMSDEGFDLLEEVELVGLAARQDRGVGSRLVVAHGGRLVELDPSPPFCVCCAFPAWAEQTHRIAVAGHEPLAV